MGIITNKPGRQNIRKFGRKGKLYKPYGFGQEGAPPPVGLNLTWNGVDSYGSFTADATMATYIITFRLYRATVSKAGNSGLLGSIGNFNPNIFITASDAIRLQGTFGGADQIQSADGVLGLPDHIYTVSIDYSDHANIIVLVDTVEVINAPLAGLVMNGMNTMAAFAPGPANFLAGILKDVRIQNLTTAADYEWAIDSGSTVSEPSIRDANTLVFNNVVAGDWS